MTKSPTDSEVVNFSSETEEIRNKPRPVFLSITTITISVLIIILLGFAAVARVDRVVTSDRGKIVPVQGAILFQALDTSIIKSLDVREGDQVKKGTLLATLDPTFAAADVEQLENQLLSLDAQIGRAIAEQNGEPYDPKQIQGGKNNYLTLQKSLFEQRRSQLRSQVESFDQKIAQTQATIERLRGDDLRYREREKISRQIEDMRQQLVYKQAGSLLNLLIATDTRLEMLRTMENGRNSLVEAQHQLSALQSDKDAFVQQWMSVSSQDLVTAQGARDNVVSQLMKAARRKDLVQLNAPEDAIILTRAPVSVGSVLREGEKLMTLTPINAPLEAEITIPAREVGFIRPGDGVTLKIDAFPFTEYGSAVGKLGWISEGSFSADDNGTPTEPYYKARVIIKEQKFVRVPPTFRLIPGMTLKADIHIGERSVLGYVIAGATRGLTESMREP